MMLLERSEIKKDKKDMEAIAELIQNGIFKGGEIPRDIRHLLWLLENYESHYVNLVLSHPSLLVEVANLTLFKALYGRLQEILQLDEAKYNRIVSKLPYCMIDQNHWKVRSQHRKYLMNILQQEDKINLIGPGYSNNGAGLLKFLSDSCWDLVDYSVGEVKMAGQERMMKVVLFEYQIQHMFGAAFPEIICRFHKAMHDENEASLDMFTNRHAMLCLMNAE
ncbi:hypothetical protein ACP70R_019009 [Stipagrostis hirtigluma subsp. patula]